MKALAALLALLAGALAACAAEPLRPRHDDEVLQRLDNAGSARAAQRALQRRLAQQPRHEPSALRLAGLWLAQARAQGDARFAGRALALLQPFEPTPPPAVAVLQATLLQHLHAFEPAAQRLQQLLARHPDQAQAWLLLASVRRTQARLADSDAACAGLGAAGAALHAQACALENASLRDPALPLSRWQALQQQAGDDNTRAWLLGSQAEHALRAGQNDAAERSLRAALRLHDEAYARCQLADLLQAQGRPAEALALLEPLPASDAVAVRRAALAHRLRDPRAAAWSAELAARFADQRERQTAGGEAGHLREQAQFALLVLQQPAQARQLARANLAQQREPADLLLLAQAGDAAEARRLAREWGIRDARLP